MSEQSHLSPEMGYDGQFGLERRGYNRLQVDEAVAQLRLEVRSHEESRRDLEERLSRTLDETERLKLELSAARSNGRPPHEEISERIGQILKLADDEAKSQRAKADDEIARLRADAQADTTKLRADVKAETDKNRAEAQEQAERMLSAAQEQADNTVSSAKAEAESRISSAKADADTTRKDAASEAQRVLTDATKQAETAVATAKSQAKQQLDEATARATAIHDGAERRLNLLMSRHTEAIRRLTEIRDVVTSLVAGENERGSLEDEVARIVAGAVNNGDSQPGGRPASTSGRIVGAVEGRHAGGLGQPEGRGPLDGRGQPLLSTAQRPAHAQSPATPQPATAQPGTPQAATLQAATLQAGTPQAATLQAGTPQAGTPQAGTPQAATQPPVVPRSAGASNLPAQPVAQPHGTAGDGRPGPDNDDTADGINIVRG
jgi:F0F1-type ATP synthase membrane subunit b/b'